MRPIQPSNAEIVLRGFESFNAGNWEAATRNVHPDFVWVNDEETARLTGVPIEFDYFQVWEIREGMPARIANIGDRDTALTAAGLADQSSQE